MKHVWLAGLVLIGILQSEVRSGDTLYIYIGASAQENADVQHAANVLAYDRAGGKKALLELIERKPGHELANTLLARVLLHQGDAPAALARIKRFMERGDALSPTVPVALEIATALGDKKLALRCLRLQQEYRAWVVANGRKDGRIVAKDKAEEDGSADARIAELLGRRDKAVRILTRRSTDDTSTCPFALRDLGQFRMRQGEHRLAREAFSAAISKAKRSRPSSCPYLRLDHAKALWALKMSDEALQESVDAAKALLVERECGYRDSLADAICMVAVLSKQDRRRDAAVMDDVAKLMKAGRSIGGEKGSVIRHAASAICRGESREITKTIEDALRRSPHWDTGLWCALYVGLANPDSQARLHRLLPAGSVQQRLLTAR